MSLAEHLKELYDSEGTLFGVHISPELWEAVREQVMPVMREACNEPEPVKEFPEPMQDWDDLVAYWDMPYPLELDVHCDNCGAATENWQEDSPRKFRLKAASFGGLVSFECQSCQTRIQKKHFKDGVQWDYTPAND